MIVAANASSLPQAYVGFHVSRAKAIKRQAAQDSIHYGAKIGAVERAIRLRPLGYGSSALAE